MIENFGSNVARLRKQRGMTQIELAKEIGVNKQTISNIEKGESYPTFNNLEKISKALKVTCVELFGTAKEIEFQKIGETFFRIFCIVNNFPSQKLEYEGESCCGEKIDWDRLYEWRKELMKINGEYNAL